ncbi:hypothetical protein EKE94_05120 [Mesobaculum littorinae]|uniref:Uncharacterized protein n=1 Tax=Mesobaculum littorinae TaxID=2486419 RepID=A0A438AHZ7_9RHOB|nr:hypothetical protein [Mesobaculum littorinae]RVV98312.1 hypothetical protein EKE94_05120 [Mesobaculum littorinae]
MTPEQQAYLENLCRILDVPMSTTEPNPGLALNVLARMFLVPTIEDHGERNRALNEIRGNLAPYRQEMADFIGVTAGLAVQMQEFPYWFDHQHRDTDALVEQYKTLSWTVYVLGVLGIGAGTGAAVAGAVEASKSGSVRQGAARATERLLGRGPVLEEIQRRMGPRIGVGRAGVAGAVVAVGGTIAYYSAIEQMEDIRAVLMHRFQEGDMTDDQFREVFGEYIRPQDIKKYWEM